MANYNIEMNMLNNSGGYDVLYPKVNINNIVSQSSNKLVLNDSKNYIENPNSDNLNITAYTNLNMNADDIIINGNLSIPDINENEQSLINMLKGIEDIGFLPSSGFTSNVYNGHINLLAYGNLFDNGDSIRYRKVRLFHFEDYMFLTNFSSSLIVSKDSSVLAISEDYMYQANLLFIAFSTNSNYITLFQNNTIVNSQENKTALSNLVFLNNQNTGWTTLSGKSSIAYNIPIFIQATDKVSNTLNVKISLGWLNFQQ